MLSLANPLGLLALLGIPAVLAIHFLQRKARELPVSTLFLLEQTRREAAGGQRFERLIPSIPLWMQLLAVILLTWILAEPRFQKANSVQRVAIVLDSSASMSVFSQDAAAKLETLLPTLNSGASTLELTLLESIPQRPRLYTGTSADDLLASLENWHPASGPVDPTSALRLARSLVSRDGTVIFLTDTPNSELPFEARQLSVGRKINNVGFTGVSFAREQGALVWRALVKNHGDQPATRTWQIQTATGSGTPRTIDPKPGAIATLQAAFPTDATNVRIALSPDDFPLDDTLPLVAPAPKPLTLFSATSPAFTALADKLLRALDAAEPTNDAATADLSIATYNPLNPVQPTGNAIIFVEDETRSGAWLKGGLVSEPHPLTDGLNWQSLLARETIQLERLATDTVLLWQDQRPLIFLRQTESARQLYFNFDPTLSNALKQPAFIVLLHRFAESIRSAKIAPVSLNLETGQPIELTTPAGVPLTTTATDPIGNPLPHTDLTHRSAIATPGFMTVATETESLLTAAVHFGDPREADFSACAPAPLDDTAQTAAIDRHTRPDPYWRLWIFLLLATLLTAWKFSIPKSTPTPQPS